MPPTVLLSAPPTSSVDDLREVLDGGGFAVHRHALGSVESVDFRAFAVALIDAGDQAEAATAQARRWRTELGDEHLPVVVVLAAPDADRTAQALAAGADVVLARPLDPRSLVAQVRAGLRSREAGTRVAVRAAEAQLLGEQLTRAFAQADRELDAARRVRLALLPRALPQVGAARFAASHHPRNRTGGDFYAVQAAASGRVVFLVGDVIGPGAASGLLGKFVTESVLAAAGEGSLPVAGRVLAAANRDLLRLGLEDPPLVALLVGVLDPETGEFGVARAGVPAPVFVPAVGEPESLAVPGPFLGVTETTYPTRTAALKAGEKLVVGTDGTRPEGDPNPGDDSRLLAAAGRHRSLAGQRFVDAVAADLLTHVRHEDDFTLLLVEV